MLQYFGFLVLRNGTEQSKQKNEWTVFWGFDIITALQHTCKYDTYTYYQGTIILWDIDVIADIVFTVVFVVLTLTLEIMSSYKLLFWKTPQENISFLLFWRILVKYILSCCLTTGQNEEWDLLWLVLALAESTFT